MAEKQKNISISQRTAEWLSNFFVDNEDVLHLLDINSEDKLLEILIRKGEEPLKQIMRNLEVNQLHCPFYNKGVCNVLSNRHLCGKKIVHLTFEKVTTCKILNRCTRALNHKELHVIQFFFNKTVNLHDWENFVLNQTIRDWKYWQLLIGRQLIEDCKKDKLCPFKPLTE